MQAPSLILTGYQDSLRRAVDVVAQNVANSTTAGFKRKEVLFSTYLAQTAPRQTWAFGFDAGTLRDTQQGSLLPTGNPLDVAIQGPGYFPIQTPSGVQYTRHGNFQLSKNGQIVTANGYPLLDEGKQPFSVPSDAEDLTLAADGTLTARTGGSTTPSILGKMGVMNFKREQDLREMGNGLYTTRQTPQPVTDSHLVQGATENANVQTVKEITDLIEMQRAYETAAHLLEMDHQRQTTAITRLAKSTG